MRKKPRKTELATAPPPREFRLRWWIPLATLAALVAVYWPAMYGAIIFDDNLLPVFQPGGPGVWTHYFHGGRPLYYLSLHVNYWMGGQETFPYHLTNVLLHFLDGWLVYFILRQMLELTGTLRRDASWLALFGGLVFLFHPVQTEAVAYIASRSENLSALFAFSALALLLAAGESAIGWGRAIAILGLLAAGTLTKEHVVAMAAVLILVDWLVRAKGDFRLLLRNWRLHAPLILGAIAAVPAIVFYVTRHSLRSAGFGVTDTTWYRYLFTQFEAIWIYIRLFLLPIHQSLDYNLPTAGSLFEWPVLLGVAGLAALLYLAWRYRARYPLAALGLVVFLVLLSPTSSVIPIADAATERRVYLPCIGLLLILVEGLRHWRGPAWKNVLLGGVVAVLALGTWNYCHAFTSEARIWEHAVAARPENLRARGYLAAACIADHRCADAVRLLETADIGEHGARLGRNAYMYYMNFAAALECQRQYDRAEQMYRGAIAAAPAVRDWAPLAQSSPVARAWARLATLYLTEHRWDDAFAAQKQAALIDPRFEYLAYSIRGSMDLSTYRFEEAVADFQQALRMRPGDPVLQDGLAKASRALSIQRRSGMSPPR